MPTSSTSFRSPAPLAVLQPNAAGLDIGAREIWVAVPVDRDPEPVRCFGTFTQDLEKLVAWLKQCRIDTVALESTGVYWIPVFELIEQAGIAAALIEPRQLKRVPGRKSDILDCQWIQQMHSLGLLTASFRPDAEMRTLRAYLRHRAQLIEHRAPHILHMQRALQFMNVQVHHVLSDIMGVTGQKILRAIVAGERDPQRLAAFREPGCKKDEATIAAALTGHWQAEYVFIIQQSLALYDAYTAQVAECDQALERQYAACQPRWDGPDALPEVPPVKPSSKSKNQPAFNVRAHLLRLTGVDLVAVSGISQSLAQVIIAEVSTDMSKFPTVKHFCSWLGLAPHNDISGGKVLQSHVLKTDNRAGQALRQAAQANAKSQSVFGAYYRRKRAYLGPEQATVATAHKIARVVYHLLKHGAVYEPLSAKDYDQQWQDRELTILKKKAAKLGFSLTAHPT
jgi:transposase